MCVCPIDSNGSVSLLVVDKFFCDRGALLWCQPPYPPSIAVITRVCIPVELSSGTGAPVTVSSTEEEEEVSSTEEATCLGMESV